LPTWASVNKRPLRFVPAAYEPGQNHRIRRLPGSFLGGGPVNSCQQFDTVRGRESRHNFRDRADPIGGSVVTVLLDPSCAVAAYQPASNLLLH
jgi:hypothetical protein